MNRFVFELSAYTLKTFSGLSKANVNIHGRKNIPQGPIIFTANHFTRIETIFLPCFIHGITKRLVWSLAAADLFKVSILKNVIKILGGISTKDPNRDEVIQKTLLTENVQWIIFPEGMMVKNKKLMKKNTFAVKNNKIEKRPHTGAALAAFRCEFYRERLRRLHQMGAPEFDRLVDQFEIDDIGQVLDQETFIVPVNITYYPASPKENIVSRIGQLAMKSPSKRVVDELMTEGSMLFSNVDITIRFGEPITIKEHLVEPYIESMLTVKRRIKFGADLFSKEITKQICVDLMQRYMAAIYRMTSLNYDHVMACVLKHFPYRRDGIDPYEFKCKVFYAIDWLKKDRSYHVADNLQENQIHLLTDDRFNRIEDFLFLAQATKMIEIHDGRIFKDQTRFFVNSNFHTIRIENPILVMANEIEPVGQAEAEIKKISHLSDDDVKKKIKNRLQEKILIDFSQDYAAHFIEGESKKKRIGRPVFLKHHNEIAGVLLIHGYMAAPEEMKAFAQYLHSHAFTVYVPRLKGHGTAPEDLAVTTYEQWIESVEEAYTVLRHTCKKIILGGFSTGAGLALELSSRVKDIKAVFAVAPPMRLQDLGAYGEDVCRIYQAIESFIKKWVLS